MVIWKSGSRSRHSRGRREEIMFKKKEYICTSKIKYTFQKARAFEILTRMYVREDNHERAKDTVFLWEKFAQKAWKYVHEIYPQLRGKACTYDAIDGVIREDT
jgi:hypothetical protein